MDFDASVIISDSQDSPFTLFMVNDVVYGVSSAHVLSIEILEEPTPLVNAPHYMLGILDFRGDMIPLIGLRRLFGIPPRDADTQDMLLVLNVDGVTKGVVADEIVSVEYISKFVEMHTGGAQSRYVRNLAKRDKDDSTVLMLDESLLVEM